MVKVELRCMISGRYAYWVAVGTEEYEDGSGSNNIIIASQLCLVVSVHENTRWFLLLLTPERQWGCNGPNRDTQGQLIDILPILPVPFTSISRVWQPP